MPLGATCATLKYRKIPFVHIHSRRLVDLRDAQVTISQYRSRAGARSKASVSFQQSRDWPFGRATHVTALRIDPRVLGGATLQQQDCIGDQYCESRAIDQCRCGWLVEQAGVEQREGAGAVSRSGRPTPRASRISPPDSRKDIRQLPRKTPANPVENSDGSVRRARPLRAVDRVRLRRAWRPNSRSSCVPVLPCVSH